MKWSVLLGLFLTAGVTFAETSATKNSVSDEYIKMTQERLEQFTQLQKEIVFEDKKCLADEFSCALKEIDKLGLQSTNDLYGAVNVLTSLYHKKLKNSGQCQEVCRSNLNAEFIKSALEMTEGLDVKKFLVYEKFQGKELETVLIRAGEDLSTFELIQRISRKLLQLNAQVDPTKIFITDLAKEAKEFEDKIIALEKAPMLKDSSLKSLKPGTAEFKAFLESDAEGKKAEEKRKEAVDKFLETVPSP